MSRIGKNRPNGTHAGGRKASESGGIKLLAKRCTRAIKGTFTASVLGNESKRHFTIKKEPIFNDKSTKIFLKCHAQSSGKTLNRKHTGS